jgi:uncharacterized membrane protein
MSLGIDFVLAAAMTSIALFLIGGVLGYDAGYNKHKMETLEKQAE